MITLLNVGNEQYQNLVHEGGTPVAIDQREALIAAVRKQVEKERAEKAAKLEREQEAMAISGKKAEP